MQGYVSSAIKHIGGIRLGERLNLWPSSFTKWEKNNRLPQTELAGLTNYARTIEEMSGGKFSAEKLIEVTRENWEKQIAMDTAKEKRRKRA